MPGIATGLHQPDGQSRKSIATLTQVAWCCGGNCAATSMYRSGIRATAKNPVQNPYDVIGVPRDADESEIKLAFRRLAAQHHPDKNQNDPTAQQRFANLNAAYQILSDPQKRAAYDRFGEAAFRPGGFGANSPGSSGFDVGSINLGDFVNFDNIIGDLLGKVGVRFTKSGDVRQQIVLSFEDAARGCERNIEYAAQELCPRCNGIGGEPGAQTAQCGSCEGRGRIRATPLPIERSCPHCRGSGKRSTRDCTTCRGSGLLSVKRTRSIHIPPGTESGSTRQLRGEGSRPSTDRPAGDLLVEVTVQPHEFFRRRDDDLLCRMKISFTQAALGAEIEVSTLDGTARLRVPAGTQPGTLLKMRGKGLPHRVRGGRGDQLVEMEVEVPRQLSPHARALVEALSQELGHSVATEASTIFDRVKSWF
jgi:molecular chaperone DnaJ